MTMSMLAHSGVVLILTGIINVSYYKLCKHISPLCANKVNVCTKRRKRESWDKIEKQNTKCHKRTTRMRRKERQTIPSTSALPRLNHPHGNFSTTESCSYTRKRFILLASVQWRFSKYHSLFVTLIYWYMNTLWLCVFCQQSANHALDPYWH